MTLNNGYRPFPGKGKGPSKSRDAPFTQVLNHPVPIDEFDRERMGLAAKE